MGTAAVLAATYLSGEPNAGYPWHTRARALSGRPPPIRIDSFEKEVQSEKAPDSPSPKEISIKLPTTPFLSDAGLTTSRPNSPGHARISPASRSASGGYFDKNSHNS